MLRRIARFLGKMRLYARVGLTRMTPRKAWVMARYWVMRHVLGRPVPWLIELSVTYECQCRCPHCSVGKYLDESRKADELSTEEMKSILGQAVAIGIPKVDFFGGEPLLRHDILELVRYGESLGIYTSVTTNGWDLSRGMVEKLEKAGVSCVNISIDSTTEKVHDRLRGLSGLFEKAREGFLACADAGIPTIFSTYVMKRSIRGFEPGERDESELTGLIRLARDFRAAGVRILFPILSGKWEDEKKKELTEEEKAHVINSLDPSFAFIEGAYSVVKGQKSCQSLSGHMFNISPYGDVQLCVVYPESFGNLKAKPLAQVLADMYSHPTYLKNKGGSCCNTTELAR